MAFMGEGMSRHDDHNIHALPHRWPADTVEPCPKCAKEGEDRCSGILSTDEEYEAGPNREERQAERCLRGEHEMELSPSLWSITGMRVSHICVTTPCGGLNRCADEPTFNIYEPTIKLCMHCRCLYAEKP